MSDEQYAEPRLAALYDRKHPRGADADFCTATAARVDARTIVDVGCGTGRLARELATPGRRVVGIDPSPTMLAIAQAGRGADRVEWVAADASRLGAEDADLVVMTGNVAQAILADDAWLAALRAIRAALRPGGLLVFDSREPGARPWEGWTRARTRRVIETSEGPVEWWVETVSARHDRVAYREHHAFARTGEVLVARSELRFRSRAQLERSLATSGLGVEAVHGDWRGAPWRDGGELAVVVARRDG